VPKRTLLLPGGLMAAALLCLAAMGCSNSDDLTSSTTEAAIAGTVPDDEIRIGLAGPLTGAQSGVGRGMLNGARMAADELNALGGIDGRMITIVEIDDQADLDAGVSAATAAIAEGLSGVVGPYNSSVGARTLLLYIDAGLVPLRLTSADATAGLGFTLQPMTSQIAPVATIAIAEWAGASSVALIYDETEEYTVDASTAMSNAITAAGIRVTANVAITPGADSYADAVAEATAGGVDLVYVIAYYPEGGLVAQAMLESAPDTTCLADYGAYDAGYITAAGARAAQNCPVVGVPAPDDFPDSAERVARYTAAFHEPPGTWAPYTYDSVMLLASVASEVGSFDEAPLRSALEAIIGWRGWTGSVSFDASTGNRQPAPVVVLSTRHDGTLHMDEAWRTATGFEF
jgi:branched-chain amino acid transport system substrate-binding protein